MYYFSYKKGGSASMWNTLPRGTKFQLPNLVLAFIFNL